MTILNNNAPRKITREGFRMIKAVRNCLKFANHSGTKSLLFIIGCQRSGTTLLTHIFDNDLNTKVYKEVSRLSRNNIPKTRLEPFKRVRQIIDRDSAPLIVLKPLVETQNANTLLGYFENSNALWAYRHYKDVAASNLKHFGIRNGICNLKPIVKNEPGNWRSEHVPEHIKTIVRKYFAEDMNPYDAAALFWFVRNSFFFELALNQHPRVMMCKYDVLVNYPSETVRRIYEFWGHRFPGEKILKEVHPASVGKGKNISLSPDIDRLCGELLKRLNETYETR
jgi:hypothetical protein